MNIINAIPCGSTPKGSAKVRDVSSEKSFASSKQLAVTMGTAISSGGYSIMVDKMSTVKIDQTGVKRTCGVSIPEEGIVYRLSEDQVLTNIAGWRIPKGDWKKVVYGDGIVVALSTRGNGTVVRRYSTTDPVSKDYWENVTPRGVTNLEDIAYGNGYFVIVSSTERSQSSVLISKDGISWTVIDPGIQNGRWLSIAYGDGKFLVTGDKNMSAHNPNHWSERSNLPEMRWRSLAYGNGRFVGCNGSPQVMVTENIEGGRESTGVVTIPDGSLYDKVSYARGVFFISDSESSRNTKFSGNGVDWVDTGVEYPQNSVILQFMEGENGIDALTSNGVVNILVKASRQESRIQVKGYYNFSKPETAMIFDPGLKPTSIHSLSRSGVMLAVGKDHCEVIRESGGGGSVPKVPGNPKLTTSSLTSFISVSDNGDVHTMTLGNREWHSGGNIGTVKRVFTSQANDGFYGIKSNSIVGYSRYKKWSGNKEEFGTGTVQNAVDGCEVGHGLFSIGLDGKYSVKRGRKGGANGSLHSGNEAMIFGACASGEGTIVAVSKYGDKVFWSTSQGGSWSESPPLIHGYPSLSYSVKELSYLGGMFVMIIDNYDQNRTSILVAHEDNPSVWEAVELDRTYRASCLGAASIGSDIYLLAVRNSQHVLMRIRGSRMFTRR